MAASPGGRVMCVRCGLMSSFIGTRGPRVEAHGPAHAGAKTVYSGYRATRNSVDHLHFAITSLGPNPSRSSFRTPSHAKAFSGRSHEPSVGGPAAGACRRTHTRARGPCCSWPTSLGRGSRGHPGRWSSSACAAESRRTTAKGPLTARPSQQATTSGSELRRCSILHVVQWGRALLRVDLAVHLFLRDSAAGGRPGAAPAHHPLPARLIGRVPVDPQVSWTHPAVERRAPRAREAPAGQQALRRLISQVCPAGATGAARALALFGGIDQRGRPPRAACRAGAPLCVERRAERATMAYVAHRKKSVRDLCKLRMRPTAPRV